MCIRDSLVHFPKTRLHHKNSHSHNTRPPIPEFPKDTSEASPLDAASAFSGQSPNPKRDAYVDRDPMLEFLKGSPGGAECREEVMSDSVGVEESKGNDMSSRSKREEGGAITDSAARNKRNRSGINMKAEAGKAEDKARAVRGKGKTAHRRKRKARAQDALREGRIECSCGLGRLENSTNDLVEQIVYTVEHRPEFVEQKLESLKEHGFQSSRREEVVGELVESTVFAALPKYYRGILADDDFDISALAKLPDDAQLEDLPLAKACKSNNDLGRKRAYVSDIDRLLKSHIEGIKSSIHELRSAGKALYENAKVFDDFIKKSVIPKVNPIEVARYFKRMKDMPKENCDADSPHSKSNDSEFHLVAGKLRIDAIEIKSVKRNRPSLFDYDSCS
eukprot:TRINITY_DN12505_c0_g1_i8.p1 TRINITY_DN12505_c0_g1~~TRINITY_DN12505_c0_g1_i8.p1  ORF type:complete len:391 (-),score=64.07 TRINITY_DN12505_c0_g1_i8:156-1328(-)